MSPWPDAEVLRAFLERTSRRIAWLAVIQGAAIGLTVALDFALLFAVINWPRATSAGIIAASLLLGLVGIMVGVTFALLRRPSAASAAIDVERRAPQCRNVVLTASELLAEPTRVEPYIGEMVWREAAIRVKALDPRALFPARRRLMTLGAIAGTWAVALTVVAALPRHGVATARARGSVADTSIRLVIEAITVTPPTYSGFPVRRISDQARIDALVGSRIDITVQTNADAVAFETLTGRTVVKRTAGDTFIARLVADADGFIAVEGLTADGHVAIRRLIGLTATPDRPPRVRITAPGKDMFIPDPRKSFDVTIEADDDLALESLTLRYTKVSGSGERFTFVEGETPIAITKRDDRAWKARATFRLEPLKLEAGDMVVYRGVASDRRPGAPPTESDAFIVEITSPGTIAADGFALDDEQDKYALSQQMVILKTERLLARKATLSADSLTYYSQTIGAEQRAVRAQFVFMMGGELAEEVIAAAGITDLNETAEAEGEADLAAGRMANRGRVALVLGIRSMSQASASLNSTVVDTALVQEKKALTYIQQAFSRTRYLLRALTQRERLDLSRRLTGVLTTAARDVHPAIEAEADPRTTALRRALAGIAALSSDSLSPKAGSTTATVLAQNLLQVDPGSDGLQKVAAQLTEAAGALERGRVKSAHDLLDGAATHLATILRGGLLTSPNEPRAADVTRLQGALVDELRRLRGSR